MYVNLALGSRSMLPWPGEPRSISPAESHPPEYPLSISDEYSYLLKKETGWLEPGCTKIRASRSFFDEIGKKAAEHFQPRLSYYVGVFGNSRSIYTSPHNAAPFQGDRHRLPLQPLFQVDVMTTCVAVIIHVLFIVATSTPHPRRAQPNTSHEVG